MYYDQNDGLSGFHKMEIKIFGRGKNLHLYRVSQETWEFSDELDIVFVMN